MNRQEAAAYVFSQSVAALAEIESMKVENMVREQCKESPAYYESNFLEVIDKYSLHSDNVLTVFNTWVTE